MEIPKGPTAPWASRTNALKYLLDFDNLQDIWQFVFDHINKEESRNARGTVIVLPTGAWIWLDDDPTVYLRGNDERCYCRVNPTSNWEDAFYLYVPEQLYAWVAYNYLSQVAVHAASGG